MRETLVRTSPVLGGNLIRAISGKEMPVSRGRRQDPANIMLARLPSLRGPFYVVRNLKRIIKPTWKHFAHEEYLAHGAHFTHREHKGNRPLYIFRICHIHATHRQYLGFLWSFASPPSVPSSVSRRKATVRPQWVLLSQGQKFEMWGNYKTFVVPGGNVAEYYSLLRAGKHLRSLRSARNRSCTVEATARQCGLSMLALRLNPAISRDVTFTMCVCRLRYRS